MADRDDARPQFNPKHRIVGAIIIVSLAVIFLPMIFDERQPPPELKGVSETPVRERTPETRVVIAPVAPVETQIKENSEVAPKAITPPPVPVSPPKPIPKSTAPAPAPPPKKAKVNPAPEKPKVVAAPTEKISAGWMLQVGIFSNTENATRLRDNLKSHGHAVHAEAVVLEGKKATRLRVGPFQDKAQAVNAQVQIHNETGVPAVMQTYP
ncbi:MAG: SPOR domain-containing protein [Gammaproteobacteria bacterium]|nr:SPOR domain-containing protein [Gammaproteobacteria bacterium]